MFKNALTLKKLSVKDLCVAAMLVAITLILSYVSGFLRIGDFAKFNFSFISVYVAGVIFGPYISGTVAALADVISFVANPTGAFVPIFTVLEFLNGFLFGLFLYRGTGEGFTKLSFVVRTLVCVALQLAVNLFIRTYFLSELYYGGNFLPLFITRIPTTGIMAAIKVVVMIALEPFMKMIVKAVTK
ncbi:MAG: folate family ECF transporter S component [Ruminococcaceae bacterium]|nr:folate family ECF transporter S component [Oscillospiraceae bacterium]